MGMGLALSSELLCIICWEAPSLGAYGKSIFGHSECFVLPKAKGGAPLSPRGKWLRDQLGLAAPAGPRSLFLSVLQCRHRSDRRVGYNGNCHVLN